ncbi:MAG: hypothetical protein ABSG73_10925 [Candidatus Aminicenantales bacterium]|jgi:hypothetical protein
MKRLVLVMFVLLAATAVMAEDLTVGEILSAHRAGADANGLVKMINDPVYTAIKITPADLETLKAAGVPQEAITALQARMPAPPPAPALASPDDQRLVDIVRLAKSGLSEALITDQIKTSNQSYDLSANDLVYLKENGVNDAIVKELLASKAKAVAPPAVAAPAVPAVAAVPAVQNAEDVVSDLVLVKTGLFQKDHPGRLVVKQDGIDWVDAQKPADNFSFKPAGIEKLWFSSRAKGAAIFPFRVNIQISKGARYRFQDVNKETGSNSAVQKLFEVIKTRFPSILIGEPEIEK